jgi:hypothetical protein
MHQGGWDVRGKSMEWSVCMRYIWLAGWLAGCIVFGNNDETFVHPLTSMYEHLPLLEVFQ